MKDFLEWLSIALFMFGLSSTTILGFMVLTFMALLSAYIGRKKYNSWKLED